MTPLSVNPTWEPSDQSILVPFKTFLFQNQPMFLKTPTQKKNQDNDTSTIRIKSFTPVPMSIPNIPNISQCIYGGMTFSILSRIVFIVLLYINKSKKILSCTVCGLNVLSNSFWIPYAFSISSKPLMIRSVMDLSLSFFGMSYILYNRYGSSLVQSVCPSKETFVDRDKQHTHRIVQEDGGIGSRI